MAADGSKKPKTQESSDHMDSDYVLSIQKLQDVQDELEKVNEQATEEVLQLEQKYNEIKKPVFERREEIIKTIPHFWLTAFSSHPVLGELLNGEDRKIFKYLDSLEVEDFKDVASGYSLTFNFKPNPFFEDTKLVKKYTFLDEGITRISVSAIKWKEGMGPAAVGSLEKGNKRPLPEDSFISWFSDDQQKEFTDGVVADEVAEIIKEDLWTNPLKYFSMEGDEESSDGDEDDEDDEEESIDEEDEDDEDSDSED